MTQENRISPDMNLKERMSSSNIFECQQSMILPYTKPLLIHLTGSPEESHGHSVLRGPAVITQAQVNVVGENLKITRSSQLICRNLEVLA